MPTMPLSEEQRDLVSQLLAHIYMKAGKQLARSRHSAHDVFNHRVRFHANKPTLGQFASKLSNNWGIQSLPVDVLPIIEALEPVQKAVLRYLRVEHIPACMRAIALVQDWREQRKHGNANRGEDRWDARNRDAAPALWDGEDGFNAESAHDDFVGPQRG